MAIARELIRVWSGAGMENPGRCRECKNPIVWRVNARTGKSLPFNPNALVLGIERDDRGRRFELLSPDQLHFAQCPARRASGPRERR